MTIFPIGPRIGRPIFILLLGLPASACSNPFANRDCSTLGVAAISVTVVDASTNRAPTTTPSLRIEDGTFVETHVTPFPRSDPPQYSGAVERPGTYRVVVHSTGYQDFVLDNIKVSRDGRCQYLMGARLTIKLVANVQ